MGSTEAIRRVIPIVRKQQHDARIAAVVVSAMSGVTDQLIDIATRAAAKDDSYKKLIRDIEKRHIKVATDLISERGRAEAISNIKALIDSLEGLARGVYLVSELSLGALDYVMSYGERLSAHLLTDALLDRGVRVEYLNARNIITTDETFGEALVNFPQTNKTIRAYFRKHPKLQIVTGFIASTPRKATTTLGRGGSDYSASILGAALKARSIEIWTDVSGVMTADPRKVKDALPIATMSYLEAAEMSYFGAKVLHPPTMRPAMENNIPIHIKNTFAPDAPGTIVSKKTEVLETHIKGITSVNNIAVIQVEGSGLSSVRGASGRLFGSLARAKVNVILITQASSQHSISLVVTTSEAERAREAIEEEFVLELQSRLINPVIITPNLSILSIVGEGMKNRRGIAGRFFQTIGQNGINIVAIAQGASELNISIVIKKEDSIKALNAVHAAFFSPEQVIINVFMVGTGIVGAALLKQIARQAEALEREHGYVVRLIALADEKRMVFDDNGGMQVEDWQKHLKTSKTKMNIRTFIEQMKAMDLPNSVFVDCTTSEEIAARYIDVFRAGVSIATPNKSANAGSYERYLALKAAASKYGVKYMYETNVGAGLPVLGTLKDLLLSGDRVRKIEAVLSGTLSHVFDNFKGTRSFSDVVLEARKLGLTEHDPRSDLSGQDVARKILILARDMGLPLKLKDVKVQNLLSERARKAPTVEKFFEQLKKEDHVYETKKRAAEKSGKVLRYVATLNKGKASVSLQAVDALHPFYVLYGNDNVVAFFTDRYQKSPLVIQGPGAGAEVTAAGLFADILRIVVVTM